jgi:uncharacterized Zn-binding protein involved in type VI secretion
MPTGFVATVAATTDVKPGKGIVGKDALAPAGPGFVMAVASKTICEYLPVAKVGDSVSPHGNFSNPRAPGYNPLCAHAKILTGLTTVLVEGRPMAIAGPGGSILSCGHWLEIPRTKTTVASGGLG